MTDNGGTFGPADPDLPLGVDSAQRRHDHVHPLPGDSTVVFFTDGLVEHRDHSLE
ncbi:SpoIIE family protein phosphatase [Streptomyces lydicus]|uniref:SpoIIE family protein phosphatase n=1 Tax=Streptomyces lydicus TaxID=47763 RepID=UPI0036EF589C